MLQQKDENEIFSIHELFPLRRVPTAPLMSGSHFLVLAEKDFEFCKERSQSNWPAWSPYQPCDGKHQAPNFVFEQESTRKRLSIRHCWKNATP